MIITEGSLLKIGLQKLLDILELDTKEDLVDYMVSNDVYTLEELAMFLNEYLGICERCFNNYCTTDFGYDRLLCRDCEGSLYEKDC